jgi:hypothetical protein
MNRFYGTIATTCRGLEVKLDGELIQLLIISEIISNTNVRYSCNCMALLQVWYVYSSVKNVINGYFSVSSDPSTPYLEG